MATSVWKGHLTFGLVSLPVKLFTAARSETLSFNQLHKHDNSRIKQVIYCQAEDKPIPRDEIVKGYEYEKGKYAIIEPEDLKRLRIPGKDTLEIVQFSPASDLPPSLYVKPYFVVPKKGPQATAFAIVRQAMVDSGMVGLGKIAFAGREHLVALEPAPEAKQRGMMLYILRFAEELKDPGEYFDKIPATKSEPAQLKLARQLIESYTRPLELAKFTDDYEAAVRELVEAKLANKPLPRPKAAQGRGKVTDLMSALRQSLAAKDAPEGAKKAAPGKRKLKVVGGRRSKTA
jgi:DNA end-binding protein Ku